MTVPEIDINKLRSINEKYQLEALKDFYKKDVGQKREAQIAKMKRISLKINPAICLGFVIVYWSVGMKHYFAEV